MACRAGVMAPDSGRSPCGQRDGRATAGGQQALYACRLGWRRSAPRVAQVKWHGSRRSSGTARRPRRPWRKPIPNGKIRLSRSCGGPMARRWCGHIGFAHQYRPLSADEVRFVLTHHWRTLGFELAAEDFTDTDEGPGIGPAAEYAP